MAELRVIPLQPVPFLQPQEEAILGHPVNIAGDGIEVARTDGIENGPPQLDDAGELTGILLPFFQPCAGMLVILPLNIECGDIHALGDVYETRRGCVRRGESNPRS